MQNDRPASTDAMREKSQFTIRDLTMGSFNHESLLEEISRLLPAPVQDDIHTIELHAEVVLIGGDPGEVVVQIDDGIITISEYTVAWKSPHTPVIEAEKVGTLNWEQIPATALKETLRELITKTIEIRRAKYRTCEKCGETNPPEWMHSDDVCQSCAEQHLGVVY